MDNMKLLKYAYNSAVTKWWRYLNIASKNSGHSLGEVATKMQNEAMADVNAIAEMIRAEEAKQCLNVDVIAELRDLAEKIVAKEQSAGAQKAAGTQCMKQAIKEAPYVLVIKWNNPIMGEMEYPFKSYAEAEKNFEVAKREVGNHHATEAHVYEQGEGQRVPVMGIMSGKL